MSKKHAITIIGHSQTHKGGESIQVQKFSHLLNVKRVEDVFQLLDGRYDSMARLNYALADGGHQMMNDLIQIPKIETKEVLLLSFCQSLAALYATGISKKHRLISKFYVHHRNERVLPLLYEGADLLLTESFLANSRALAYGIPKNKMLLFPHYYPKEAENYKKPEGGKITIGIVSRIERGKNCEYALEACRRIADRHPIEVILMGDFEKATTDPEYQKRFRTMLDHYEEADWFHFEPDLVPYPQVLRSYSRFDICLQLSGSEAGSNVITEMLGMGKPVIALNASTNPYLFKDGAYLVEAEPEDHPGQLYYQVPNIDAVEGALEALVSHKKLREEWGKRAQTLARRRFHEDLAHKRKALLFADKETIAKQFDEDRREYEL
ncbi:MAG: hypothetical protein S4CHLAM81_05520 [Chlamydiales bacterium]|nr:hypothetical protein [Chlamydiales bacterium]MCH9635337.1 hypothetical protein [Chlamydiales bacterium]